MKKSLLFTIEEKNEDRLKRLEKKTALHAKVEQKYWIIECGCSNHMTRGNDKFINLKK